MQIQAQIKAESRNALRGHYGVAGLLAVLPFLISAAVAGLEWLTARLFGVPYWEDLSRTPQYFFDDRLRLALSPLFLFAGVSLLKLLLTAPLNLGTRRWYLKLVDGDNLPLHAAFWQYGKLSRILRAVWLTLNLSLRRAVLWLITNLPALLGWAGYLYADCLFPTVPWIQPLLFLIFLVLFATCQVFYFYWKQRYFLTEFLCLIYPCKLRDAVKMSTLVMKKQKNTVFSLYLSCLPLALLSLLILPGWHTLPRIYAAQAACAKMLIEEYEAAKQLAFVKSTQQTIPLPELKRLKT